MKKGVNVNPIIRSLPKSQIPRESMVVLSLVALFFVAFGIYAFRPGGLEGLTASADALYVLFAAITASFGFWAYKKSGTGPQGKLILFLAIAFAMDAIAGAIWMYYEVFLHIAPFPTLADGIWGVYYLLASVGFALVVARIRKFISMSQIVVALVVWGIIVTLVAQSTLVLIFNDSEYSLVAKLFSAMYPMGDLIVMLLVLMLFTALRKGVYHDSLVAFLIAFSVQAVGDLIYVYQSWTGVYETGSLLDLFWLAGQLLVAYGFYLQVKAVQPRS